MAKNDQVDMSRARILGTPKDEEVRAGGFTPVLFIKGGLDENNTLKPKTVNKQLNTVMGPNGPQMVEQVQAVLGREQLCTAEDLVEMVADKVYESVAIYFTHITDRLDELENNLKARMMK